jgi:hypothetical protein
MGDAGPDGKRRLFGPSLHRLVQLTVAEGKNGGLRFVKWAPHPGFGELEDAPVPKPLVEVGWAVAVPA